MSSNQNKERIELINIKYPEIAYIIDDVCDYFNVSKKQMMSKDRYREVVDVRHTLSYILIKLYPTLNLKDIAIIIGRDSHATVISSNKAMQNLMTTQKKVKETVFFLIENIRKKYKISDYNFNKKDLAKKLIEIHNENEQLRMECEQIMTDFRDLEQVFKASLSIKDRIQSVTKKILK